MEAVATKEGHGKGCGPRGGPIGGVYGTAISRIFYRTPAGYTAKKKTRRKRNRGCQGLLSVAHQSLPPPPPHRAPAALPGAELSGLAERRPPPSPLSPP
jgi:hypothetical protein